MKEDVFHHNVEGNRVVIVNPINDYSIKKNDVLFIITESMPKGI